MKRTLEVVGWAVGLLIFAFATHSALAQEVRARQSSQQTGEQHVTVTVRPSQTVDQRVADEYREKELRRAYEEKRAAEEAARIAESSPRALLGRARTLFIYSGTSFFEPVQLQNALQKRDEMETWRMAIVDGWNKRDVADLHIEVDRPLFTYTFTYRITDRRTGIILATGKVTAFDGNAAAPKLAKRIVEEIKRARGEETKEKEKK
ncbi:MAG TPA: hypothetical protein VFX96_18905 [Pyrinomonadaceae bacterium]|nr:hypothetical protein [Pyrinomonadaceae bacterium]